MSSERKWRANQENAKRSTGPKTQEGKRKSSRNATRHGLEEHTVSNASVREKMDRIALMLSGNDGDEVELDLARVIAESEITLMRVRTARVHAIEKWRKRGSASESRHYHWASRINECIQIAPHDFPAAASMVVKTTKEILVFVNEQNAAHHIGENAAPQVTADSNRELQTRSDLECLSRASPELLAIERYERRTLSRRRKAMDAFRYIRSARLNRQRREPRP